MTRTERKPFHWSTRNYLHVSRFKPSEKWRKISTAKVPVMPEHIYISCPHLHLLQLFLVKVIYKIYNITKIQNVTPMIIIVYGSILPPFPNNLTGPLLSAAMAWWQSCLIFLKWRLQPHRPPSPNSFSRSMGSPSQLSKQINRDGSKIAYSWKLLSNIISHFLIETRLKILPVLTREHYTSLLHWV
jgi:hypothetical protein